MTIVVNDLISISSNNWPSLTTHTQKMRYHKTILFNKMKDVLASYNSLSYLALSKEMLRLCEGTALEIKRMFYCLSF